MKILVVDPLAGYSTGDVYRGITKYLARESNTEVIKFHLGKRIEYAAATLNLMYRDLRKKYGESVEVPTITDYSKYACNEIFPRALKYLPDWIVLVTGMYFYQDYIIYLRRMGFKVAVVFTESPYDDEAQAKLATQCDVFFTNDKLSVEYIQNKSKTPGYYLPASYDPEIHFPEKTNDDSVPKHDIVFVGTGFPERNKFLRSMPWKKYNIDLGLYGNFPTIRKNSQLKSYIRKGVIPNSEASNIYKNAKAVLNFYRTDSAKSWNKDIHPDHYGYSLNPRATELAAMKVLTISSYRDEAKDLYYGSEVTDFSLADTESFEAAVISTLASLYMPEHKYHIEKRYEAIKNRTFQNAARMLLSICT